MTRLLARLLITILVLILGVSLALPAVAADGITVVESGAHYSFAQQVTFTLQAVSDARISQVYLFFRATGDKMAQSIDVAIADPRDQHQSRARFTPLPPATVRHSHLLVAD